MANHYSRMAGLGHGRAIVLDNWEIFPYWSDRATWMLEDDKLMAQGYCYTGLRQKILLDQATWRQVSSSDGVRYCEVLKSCCSRLVAFLSEDMFVYQAKTCFFKGF